MTDRVDAALSADADGVATVFVPHTTAGVVVGEAESGLLADLRSLLADLVPEAGDYRHDAVDDNAAAHLRATVLGEHVAVPVSAGALDLGTWQSVLFVECDGPRERRVRVRA
ncbi:MAG: secondary thiamine-phosphate synthase enzyme YjbQ [Halobacteriaceae archaeon]